MHLSPPESSGPILSDQQKEEQGTADQQTKQRRERLVFSNDEDTKNFASENLICCSPKRTKEFWWVLGGFPC